PEARRSARQVLRTLTRAAPYYRSTSRRPGGPMSPVTRRDFARYVALSGSAALWRKFPSDLGEFSFPTTPLPRTSEPDEKFWQDVRSRYLMPPDFAFVNAANVCPTSLPVVEALEKNTRMMEADPSAATRAKLTEGREESRRLLATMLHVRPEEI